MSTPPSSFESRRVRLRLLAAILALVAGVVAVVVAVLLIKSVLG